MTQQKKKYLIELFTECAYMFIFALPIAIAFDLTIGVGAEVSMVQCLCIGTPIMCFVKLLALISVWESSL